MPTQKLLLFFALIVVLGGSAIWYLQVIVPAQTTDDSVDGIITNRTATGSVATDSETVKTNPVSAPAGAAAGSATVIDTDITAIDVAADAAYDDSVLETEFTTSDATTLTNSYDY